MRKVLVVEDEKLIRQGIAAMIKRSGVPYEEVIECSNGLQALDILKVTEIDVMFTDIRMPKMNGIELVQAVHDLDNPPLCVAISGYDDFSYAVEMMRNGVREYILKPVEREKLKSVLVRLDQEISSRRMDEEKSVVADTMLLKYILQDSTSTSEDVQLLGKKLQDEVGDSYLIIAAPEECIPSEHCGIFLKKVHGANIFIIPEARGDFLKSIKYIGVSDAYTDAKDLKLAYHQAQARRKEAFLQNISIVDYDIPEIPQALLESAAKYYEKKSIGMRVQLMGTDRVKELKKEWDGFFISAYRGQIPADEFIKSIEEFGTQFAQTYKEEIPEEIIKPLSSENLDTFKEVFMEFVLNCQGRLNDRGDADGTSAKIQDAIRYINENYAGDVNMAVVSNHISMNYSLFSTEFKRHTGQNFVTYVKELRMSAAKELLVTTDLKINEISAKVGYDNEKHFMKSFKAYVGISPSEYRKNARN